ncbi:MAG: glutamate synthase subunit beta [Saccharofermentanales bacterium]
MGKPTGFIEYERELPQDIGPQDRIRNWDEFHTHWTDGQQQVQGARCMECSIPFCSMGVLIKGAAAGCPISNLIPEWNDLIYKGLWEEALIRLRKTNNFPEFTGRVCPAPCEGSCTVGINDPQVTIKSNECYIIDKAWEEGWMKPMPPRVRTGKKIAVVGSGPAGLACADQLNHAGHNVTVYERADRIGGLLMYGIPNMKLDKSIVARRTGLMEAEGVVFITSTEVGRDISPEALKSGYDAVVLCGGATKPRNLVIPGRELSGIHYAMDFLKGNTKALLDNESAGKGKSPEGAPISAKGKDVIVIGGGDTGTDCVGTSIRQGCRSIAQLEIMPKPPESRGAGNPWPEWPMVRKTDYGQEEAIELYGKDPRSWLTTATSFEGDAEGNLTAVLTVEVVWRKDDAGRMIPDPVPGTEVRRPAQLVLIAMGFLGPEETVPKAFGIEIDVRSNVKADEKTYRTSAEGIYAAGDMRRGQSLVVWAINEGRGAARECDRFLMGRTQLP